MEKKSFKQVRDEAEACRHNSNLSNLASGLNMIAEELERTKAHMEKLVELESAINAAGEDPNLTHERVRELYNEAFNTRADFKLGRR
jgi:hypothetical protein